MLTCIVDVLTEDRKELFKDSGVKLEVVAISRLSVTLVRRSALSAVSKCHNSSLNAPSSNVASGCPWHVRV